MGALGLTSRGVAWGQDVRRDKWGHTGHNA